MADYICYRIDSPLTVDGNLDKDVWRNAPKSPRFVDMATGAPALLGTQAAALWDDQNLYVAFWVEEPYPTAHLTERDSIIFTENDVEVFIDGGDCYYEFEINARNTIYEVFFVWRDAYTRGSRFDIPEFDVFNPRAVTFGGDYDRKPESFWFGTHPRGLRWAFLDWDMPGIQSAVQVQGSLNDPSKPSKGWTVEIAFPWEGMRHLANGRQLPPNEGDVWSIFFGRFQQIAVGQGKANPAWCWTPHGVYDTHMPDKFTKVAFSQTALECSVQ